MISNFFFENFVLNIQILDGEKIVLSTLILKNVDKWVSLCYIVGYKWVTVINGVKFEKNC